MGSAVACCRVCVSDAVLGRLTGTRLFPAPEDVSERDILRIFLLSYLSALSRFFSVLLKRSMFLEMRCSRSLSC
jgi:hypothetical protein